MQQINCQWALAEVALAELGLLDSKLKELGQVDPKLIEGKLRPPKRELKDSKQTELKVGREDR